MGKEKQYRCENKACPLGSLKSEGLFTGGMTEQGAMLLTGDPDAPYGDGYCPNCGVKGKAAGTYATDVGRDPQQKDHDKIAKRVEDPHDSLTAENAQAALEELVGEDA